MASQMNRLILAEIADVRVQLLSEQDLNLKIRQDCVASLASQLCKDDDETVDNIPAKNARRDAPGLRETLSAKT